MTPQDYEKAILADTTWRLALSNDTNELCAIASVIRNHVIVRPGQMQTYKSFPEACREFLKVYPTRPGPMGTEAAFISYPEGLLAVVDGIYGGTQPDITSTHDNPTGARYFARTVNLPADDWRWAVIKSSVLLGTFGSQQFFK